MTLEEKVNQMLQLAGGFFTGDMMAMGPMAEKGYIKENMSQAGSAFGAHGAEKLKKIQKDFMEKHPHKIPILFMLDVINSFKTILLLFSAIPAQDLELQENAWKRLVSA